MAIVYRPEDFFGVPDDIFTNLQLYKYVDPQLKLLALRKEVTDYFENEYFHNRGLDIAYSHEDGKNVERPFIGPLFEVEMPSGQKYQIIIPCSSPKEDKDYDHADREYPSSKNRVGLIDRTQSRLLLSDSGLVIPSQCGHGNFDFSEHYLLEALIPTGMLPVLSDWIEDYDTNVGGKHIWKAPPYFGTTKDYATVLNDTVKLLPQIQNELISICIDIFRQGMCLVNKHTFLPLRNEHEVSSLSDRELGKLFYTFIDLNNSKQTINDFKKSKIVDLYGDAKLRGLNFTEILMEVEVAKEFLNELIALNNDLKRIGVTRDPREPSILLGGANGLKGINVSQSLIARNNATIQMEKHLLSSDKQRVKTLENIKKSTRMRHKEKEIQLIANKDDDPNKS